MPQTEDQQISEQPPEAAPAPTPAPVRSRTAGSGLFSNLNLNGTVPSRVRPNISEWGPAGLPTTKQKKRVRWLVPSAFALILVLIVIAECVFYQLYG